MQSLLRAIEGDYLPRLYIQIASIEMLLAVAMASGCVSKPTKTDTSIDSIYSKTNTAHVELGKNPDVKAESNLPLRFDELPRDIAGVESLLISLELVDSAHTVRPRTEVRTGPGVEFELVDEVLREGERVLVYDLVGSWRRIVSPTRGIRGWAHRGTLRFDRHEQVEVYDKNTKVRIQPKLLPMVFANQIVLRVFGFSTLKPINTTIPRGRSFHLLKEHSGRKLIWLPETNSVVWVRSEEMK